MGINFAELGKVREKLKSKFTTLLKDTNQLCKNNNIHKELKNTIKIIEKDNEYLDDSTSEIRKEFDALSDVSKMHKEKHKSYSAVLEPKVEDVDSLIKKYKSEIDKLSVDKQDKLKLHEDLTIQKNLYNNQLKNPLAELKALEKSMSELLSERIALEKNIASARDEYRNSVAKSREDYSEHCGSFVNISKSADNGKALDEQQAGSVVSIIGNIEDARQEIYESLNSATRKLANLKSQLSELNNKWDQHVERKRTLTQNINIFCDNITSVLKDLESEIESVKKKIN